ncbi:MAG: diaminobutyrate--2-oxoglutarate transaminase family protein [Candidatus Aminicenantes bacterium]|nr:diaminobutyrate--2-oxoglutarate transaminase family protein [Candidatus Aminicenantes bacterium]
MDFRELSFPGAPLIKTPPPGPKSKEHLDYQSFHEGSAVSYPRAMPMALSRAKGATVEDVDGNLYIDFFGGAGVMNVGHSNPEVIEAATSQLTNLTHSLDVPNPARRALVETLLSLLPDSLNKVFFGGPTGSDAVEAAIKLARYNSQFYPLIAFEGGYHGMSAGALSLSSGLGFKEDFLPLLPEVHFVPYAYCYRCLFRKKPDSCELDCAKYLEHILEDPHSGVGKPAALIVEAIQGEGGSIVPPDQFIPKVREICSKHGIILIVDEIQTGFCRTGKMFAFEHTGILPDIVTMSKALGGIGFPISCVAYKEELDTWPPGKHIGTFRGHVVAYAAGRVALNFMVENKLVEHASHLGRSMLSWLNEIEKDSKIVGEARGKGLMLGIELVKDKESKEPAPELAKRVRASCHSHGLLIEIGGHFSNVARFLPPLILTEELALKGIEIFEDAIREAEKSMKV